VVRAPLNAALRNNVAEFDDRLKISSLPIKPGGVRPSRREGIRLTHPVAYKTSAAAERSPEHSAVCHC